MKRFLVLVMILLASSAFAGQKKAGGKAPEAESLQAEWDADESLIKLDCNDNVCLYGIKGTARVVDPEQNLRSAWVAFLYTKEGRKALKGESKGSFYSKEKWNFNCKEMRLNVSSVHRYDAKGNPLASYADDREWGDIVPGSFGETVAAIVCGAEEEGEGDEAPAEEAPGGEPDDE